eukprot:6214679-Pleurochrysis_carterae.AAC.1
MSGSNDKRAAIPHGTDHELMSSEQCSCARYVAPSLGPRAPPSPGHIDPAWGRTVTIRILSYTIRGLL